MAEFKFGTSEQAKIVLGLIENVEVEGANYPLNYYVDAARDFDNIEAALEFLNKECPTCSGLYPIHEVRGAIGANYVVGTTCYGWY